MVVAWLPRTADRRPVSRARLRAAQPPELRSADGRLQLTARSRPRAGAARRPPGRRPLATTAPSPAPPSACGRATSSTSGSSTAWTSPTNLHVHGLHVSPQGNGDNVFVAVEPGRKRSTTSYRLPPDHPPGVYWYHPHHHGMVAEQIFARPLRGDHRRGSRSHPGQAGNGCWSSRTPPWTAPGTSPRSSPMERMMGREGELLLLNGQSSPLLTARPGERERWRIVNACVARYLRLRLDGQQLQLLGMDSGRFPRPGNRGRTAAGAGQPGRPAASPPPPANRSCRRRPL